jgi:preflagellin peptidase FlaK
VDSSELISIAALSGAAVTLCYASVLDVRTRRVPNQFWIMLSLLGAALIPLRILTDEESIEFLLVLVPIGAILSDVYHDVEGDSAFARSLPALKYGVALASTVSLGILWIDDAYFQPLLAVPILMMVFVVMYILDIIKGGADAKALMALAILFPTAPVLWGFPLISPEYETMEVLFPFALGVLVDAAFAVVFLPALFLVRNLASRDIKFPQMLLGYRIDTNAEKPGFVWLMERMEEGKHRYSTRPKGDEDICDELSRLRENGVSRAWVTPKIPFILPIFAGLILATGVGNVLFLLFGL